MKLPFTKPKKMERIDYHFSLKEDEFTIETQFSAKESAFVDFFNKIARKTKVQEGWNDINQDAWELDEGSKGAVEKKLLKAMNYKGILSKVRKTKGIENLKVVYVKTASVQYQKTETGYDIKIKITGLQTGVE